MNNKLTQADIDKLQEELDYRNVTLRGEIAKEKMEAAAFGDRSENAEYKAAKQRYYENNRRIGYLSRMIRTATLIEDEDIDRSIINVGDKAIIRFIEDDETETVTLTTTVQAEPINWIISIESPLGKAIYKQKEGSVHCITSPDGDYTVRIEKIL